MDKSNNLKQELLPGQKHPTPTRGFGDRVFYESLLRQKPESIMAQEWCVYHGVLGRVEAEKLYDGILKRKDQKSIVSTSTQHKSLSSQSPVKEVKRVKKERKRRISDEDGGNHIEFDAEMNVGGYEGIGASGI